MFPVFFKIFIESIYANKVESCWKNLIEMILRWSKKY